MGDLTHMLNELAGHVTEEPYQQYVADISKFVADAQGSTKSDEGEGESELQVAQARIAELEGRLLSMTANLGAARSGAISLQCLLDSSREKLREYEVREGESKKETDGKTPSKQLVTDLKRAFKDIEIVASRQYDVSESMRILLSTDEVLVVKQAAAATRIQTAALIKKLRRCVLVPGGAPPESGEAISVAVAAC